MKSTVAAGYRRPSVAVLATGMTPAQRASARASEKNSFSEYFQPGDIDDAAHRLTEGN